MRRSKETDDPVENDTRRAIGSAGVPPATLLQGRRAGRPCSGVASGGLRPASAWNWRLTLVAGLAFCSAAPALAAELTSPSTGVLDFTIVRKNDVVGHYHSDFSRRPDQALEVRTHVSVAVTMGPIRLYAFDHNSVETWHDGRLIGLRADTDDDGEVHHLQAERRDQGLALTVDGKTSMADADAVPSTLWNRDMLDGHRPIFDIGDGQIYQTMTRCDGPPKAPASSLVVCEVSGELIRTLRFELDGNFGRIDLSGGRRIAGDISSELNDHQALSACRQRCGVRDSISPVPGKRAGLMVSNRVKTENGAPRSPIGTEISADQIDLGVGGRRFDQGRRRHRSRAAAAGWRCDRRQDDFRLRP